ncbi:MAG: hypothetical protein SVX38_03775 [Chloroflexota bacterium]|nr:hypothetical protein [Chloroflexota bacterium]
MMRARWPAWAWSGVTVACLFLTWSVSAQEPLDSVYAVTLRQAGQALGLVEEVSWELSPASTFDYNNYWITSEGGDSVLRIEVAPSAEDATGLLELYRGEEVTFRGQPGRHLTRGENSPFEGYAWRCGPAIFSTASRDQVIAVRLAEGFYAVAAGADLCPPTTAEPLPTPVPTVRVAANPVHQLCPSLAVTGLVLPACWLLIRFFQG